jgi:hypothetical protein
MLLYGMDKVRGGAYTLPNLLNQQKTLLQKELWHAQDRCIDCGGDHYVYRCPKPLPPLPPKPTLPGEPTTIWGKASAFFGQLIQTPPSQHEIDETAQNYTF